MNNINIFALGGQNENGKLCYVIEIDEDIYVVNAGIKIPINNFYGIDSIIPSFEYLTKNQNRIKGIFLTHGHDEAISALPWAIMDIDNLNIYGSTFTNRVAKERALKYNLTQQKYEFFNLRESQTIGKIEVKAFEVANSIPGSLVLSFQTQDGAIVFASNYVQGDLGPFGSTNLNYIKSKVGKILVLMHDSRKANYPDHSMSKISVLPFVKQMISNSKNNVRTIVGAYDEEMYNIYEIIKYANALDLPIALYGRAFSSFYQMLAARNPDFKIKNFLNYQDIQKSTNAIVLVTSTWARLYKRFTRIATKNDVYLKLRSNDQIIMIAPPINGLEVDYSKMLDEVAKTSPKIFDSSVNDIYKLRPTKDDISKVIEVFKPKIHIPISSLYRYLVDATNIGHKAGVLLENNVLMQNGKVIWIKDGEIASRAGRIKEIGDVMIDGFGVGDISHEVVREREVLAESGLVNVFIAVENRSKKLIEKPLTKFVGVITDNLKKDFFDGIEEIITDFFSKKIPWNYFEYKKILKKMIRKYINKNTGKEPMVVVSFQLI